MPARGGSARAVRRVHCGRSVPGGVHPRDAVRRVSDIDVLGHVFGAAAVLFRFRRVERLKLGRPVADAISPVRGLRRCHVQVLSTERQAELRELDAE